jgi:outer membrane protein assembly factor BamE (lipoprotein component of BamABCDE complex)
MRIVKRGTRICLLIALLLVVVVIAIVAIAWQHRPNYRLTKENFERIADGMTQAEVEAILGPPMSVEIYENTNWGTMVTWETRRIEGHLVYMRSINISFDPSGRKWGIGQYTNCPLDIDSWTQFRLSVVDSSPWLAQQLDWLP